MSQAITLGSLETRSREKTLFFTLLAMSASPRIQWIQWKHENINRDQKEHKHLDFHVKIMKKSTINSHHNQNQLQPKKGFVSLAT